MRAGTPFRAAQMMALAIAAVAQSFAPGSVGFNQAVMGLGPYAGRGKGRNTTHNRGGSRAYQRAAVKARNVKRYRASLKG